MNRSPFRRAAPALAAIASALALGNAPEALAAGYSVQAVKSPGPAIGMSDSDAVAGFFVAKCTTLSNQPRRTICYNAPWLFDGQRVNKLTNVFAASNNAQAVAVNGALDVIGADLYGPWYYSTATGTATYVTSADPNVQGARLSALNNQGVALGMASVGGVFQPVTYRLGGSPTPALAPGDNAVDINDASMIAGWFRSAIDGTETSFIADPTGAAIDVVIPKLAAGLNCRPVRISQHNAATNSVWVVGQCSGRPYIYRYDLATATSMLSELAFPGAINLSVQGVNSRGVAVGTAVRPGAFAPDGYTAIAWSTDYAAPVDLNANSAFAPPGAWNVHATDINEPGTILTGYNDTSGNFYTFLLRPIP